jgi:hypothetical protein
MSKYTKRIENTDGTIIAWIDRDGYQMINQPHHPSALNNEPWADEAEASAWADEAIEEIVANEKKQSQQAAETEALIAQAKIDSAKIAEMHEMILALQAKLA